MRINAACLMAVLCWPLSAGAEASLTHEPVRDPTAPLATLETAEAADAPRLSAIFLRDQSATAIVNGRPVKVGDWLDAYRVSAIAEGEVHLSGDTPLVLTLYPRVIKKIQAETHP